MLRPFLMVFVYFLSPIVSGVKIEVIRPSTVTPAVTPVIETTTVTSATTVPTNATTGSTTSTTSTTPITTTSTTLVSTTLVNPSTTIESSTESPTLNQTSSFGNSFLTFINRRAENKVKNYYCHCDFIVNVCEVNCCCDLDCSKEVIKYFNCAAGEEVNQNEYDDFGPLQDCKISGGFLCVYKSNVKDSRKGYYDKSKEEIVRKNRWPRVFESRDLDEKRNDYYELGEEVMIFNEATEMLETLTISRQFQSTSCIFDEPVTWLQSTSTNYWRSFENSSNYLADQFNKFNSSKILIYPVTPSMEYHCSPSSCGNITITHCFPNCQTLNSTEDLTRSNHKIDLLIWHNYTHIVGMNVSFIDIGQDLDVDMYFEQVFQVKWKSVEERGFESFEVSGNPGYLKEKSILVAKEVTFTNFTEENKIYVLDFFYFNNGTEPYKANRTILLPKSRNGKCLLESSSSIQFGVDVNRRCNAVLDPGLNITQTSNFTAICEIYQKQILELLAPNLISDEGNISSKIFISQLGNPQNDTRFWSNLEVRLEEAIVSGLWQSETGTFICSNMIISVRYEFFYAKLRAPGVNKPQNTIRKAVAYLEPRLDLQFKPDELAVPIFVQTQFYEVTGGAKIATVGVYFMFLCSFNLIKSVF